MTQKFIAASLVGLLLAALPASASGGAAAPAGGMGGWMGQLLLIVPLILVFYFLLFRPQQQQRKRHAEMVANIKRGDTIVTYGGLIAKVTKVSENELAVELADNVRARVARNMVAEVREKGAPVAAND